MWEGHEFHFVDLQFWAVDFVGSEWWMDRKILNEIKFSEWAFASEILCSNRNFRSRLESHFCSQWKTSCWCLFSRLCWAQLWDHSWRQWRVCASARSTSRMRMPKRFAKRNFLMEFTWLELAAAIICTEPASTKMWISQLSSCASYVWSKGRSSVTHTCQTATNCDCGKFASHSCGEKKETGPTTSELQNARWVSESPKTFDQAMLLQNAISEFMLPENTFPKHTSKFSGLHFVVRSCWHIWMGRIAFCREFLCYTNTFL